MLLISTTPPPGTMPSSRAARVAWRASSTRCFLSFISVSVAAPTLTTATPPASLARRSWSFSRSKSESVVSISALICLMRPLISSESPAPSMMVVASLETTTRRARPSWETWALASLRPISSLITSPPVRMAMSSSMRLRRSPKPGALTAMPVKVPRSLLTIRVARASPSTSSAITSSGRPWPMTCSSRGSRSCTELILPPWMSRKGSSRTASMRSWSVTM